MLELLVSISTTRCHSVTFQNPVKYSIQRDQLRVLDLDGLLKLIFAKMVIKM
jgi:hypothetical protein